ncbi:MAG: CPBP family intramembrane glutamic endopeptidase [Candidatus Binatia bacterium]
MTRFQQALALCALIALGVAAAVPRDAALWARAVPAAAALLVAVVGLFHPGLGSAVAVLAGAVAGIAVTGVVWLWQATMLLALGLLFALSRVWPNLGSVREPLGRVLGWATFGCAAVTPGALVAWVLLLQPDLSDITRNLPAVNPALLVLGGIGFALLNALCEEWIWRGVIQSRLTALFSPRVAVVVQALSFGVVHAHGFPRGIVGVALAGTWAILLGALRARAGGLLAPTIAHVVADATIATITILWLR